MIVDRLSRAERYFNIHPGFREAFEYLRSGVFTIGRNELNQAGLIAIGTKDPALSPEEMRLESHRRYIDLQYMVEGEESIGWRPIERCETVSVPYQKEKDILFYADKPLMWIPLSKGSFTIFFPEDPHAPRGGKGIQKKIVIKVPV